MVPAVVEEPAVAVAVEALAPVVIEEPVVIEAPAVIEAQAVIEAPAVIDAPAIAFAPEVLVPAVIEEPVVPVPAAQESPGEAVAAPAEQPPASEAVVEPPTAEPSADSQAAPAELPAAALVVALPSMVEQLQTEVRALQGLVAESGEQTTVELGRTTLQMVRMVTGVAHHLDSMADQVRSIAGVAQALAQTFTGVESALGRLQSTVTTLQKQTEDRLQATEHGQNELRDLLAPILAELTAQRADRVREASLERLWQYRQSIELRELQKAIEQHGITAQLATALPRAVRATRTKR
jgi:hypothetical protein